MVSDLLVAHWNANGVINKKPELVEFLNRFEIEIMCVNETRLCILVPFFFQNYRTIRKDKTRQMGGVLILVRNTVPFTHIRDNDLEHLEAIKIKLTDNIHIIAMYNSPRNT